MAEFTRGPWSYYTKPQPNGCPIIGARGLMVAMLSHSTNDESQRDTAIANASLIASAPDLYEALEQLLGNAELSRFHISATEEGMLVGSALFDTIMQARTALAKARGEVVG